MSRRPGPSPHGRARFEVEHLVTDVAGAHARVVPDPALPRVWWFEVDAPALAIGSRQRVEDVDATRLPGAPVVRRRSGGGAVWLEPGAQLWVDVVVPSGHPLANDDVRASMIVIGEAWRRALVAAGIPGERLAVHTGGVERARWSDLVCFAGIGPGEVSLDGRKLVGISQRRTRAAARFQCTLHRRWEPTRWIGAFGDATPDGPVPEVATVPDGIEDAALVAALVAALDG